MTDEHDFFTPDQVDQQVEQFSPDSPIIRLASRKLPEQAPLAEACLVSDLQGYYRDERAQDLASLERAWQQVAAQFVNEQERSRSTARSSVKLLRSSHERTRIMRKHNSDTDTPKRGKFWRGLNALAAILVAIMLVGGMIAAFKMAHATPTAHQKSKTNTASASASPTLQAVPSSPGLYLITQADTSENSQVTKVDKDTGAVLWNHVIGLSESPTVVGDNIVFGASGDQNAYGGMNASTNNHSYIYALDAKNGSQLWRTDLGADFITYAAGDSKIVANGTTTIYINGKVTTITPGVNGTVVPLTQGYNVGVPTTPTFANGVVYVTSGAGKVYALNAANGAIIWTTDVHVMDYDPTTGQIQLIQPLAVANGVVYGTTFNKLYALNAQNGHMLWSTSLTEKGYSFGAPTVADGKVFLSLDPPSTHTDVNPDHTYIAAYSADNGVQAWKSNGYYWAGFLNYAPVVSNGLVYVANFYTGIYALEEQTGQARWQHVLGTDAFTNSDGCSWPVVANGVVYTSCGYTHPSLNAYNATNGNPLWSRPSNANPDAVNGDVIYGTAFLGLVYFVKTTDGSTTHQQTYGVVAKDKYGNPWAPGPDLTLVP